MFYIIKLFIAFSIIGFFFETILGIFLTNGYQSGFLRGPWTPLYGVAIFIMIGVSRLVKKFNLSKKKEMLIYFLIITIVLTGLEFVSGHLIEMTSGKVFWNYDSLPLSFGHYVNVFISIGWGIGAVINNYYIYPKLDNWIRDVPKKTVYIVIFLIICDVALHIIRNI